ncbi:hypothetical protein O9G_005615 [Rozella allomycis CSF55]|uniref:DNA helicase Pif1-like 2B domain-containing protein n=1 Tax=Rozella allomycis (strain CSF55) TaxID=988480 RepID=A0A075B556_ROZAC|nr:hypothetical protein O9G_005615 [Rozella allomycis CSF55]|eukprot:EPZ36923.1 hypothetical protein O9G_005615 [Rozella allomycis CSF55]
MPIILLRNLDPSLGLFNGTRLIIRCLGAILIDAEIALGKFKGHRVLIPRIVLSPSQTTLPFVLRRKLFPVSCHDQEQSAGSDLEKGPVFTHGQTLCGFIAYKSYERHIIP